ncbi:MAG: hypothetical protein SGJ13_04675, partial [Actinomycetota bacterium]|nr:hypothetical protein [Actinomycetota bacterium]
MAGGLAVGLIAAVSAAAVDGDAEGRRVVAETSPTTTTEAPETSTTTAPPTTTTEPAPAPTTTTTAAPAPPRTTTTTTVDTSRLEDWTNVRIVSPRGFNISIGETITFEFTM